jgi:type IV pilus assembly protein PilW
MKMYPKIDVRYAKGFTIVEMLVALTLGMLLIAAILQVLGNHKLLVNTETSLSRVQESGRFVMGLLTNDIRKIGYHGCSDPSEMNVVVMATSGVDADFGSTTLRGFEVGAGGAFSPAIVATDALIAIQGTAADQARIGSDVIQLKYADRTGAKLIGNTDPVNANIKVDGNPSGLSQNDIAIIADCQSAHVFSITNVTTSGGQITMAHASSNNSPNKMLPGYNAGADLMSYRDVTYYVADTGRNKNGIDVFALYRKESSSAAGEELIEGVEFLQVLYGEIVPSGNIRFVPADTAGLDMQSVVAVRFSVLIQDFEISLPQADTRSYSMLDATITPAGALSHSGSRYLRRPFSATVQLRNQRSSISNSI